MKFDLFHSLARVDQVEPRLSNTECFNNFIEQVQLAEELGFGCLWLAESHFSSEVQKRNREPVIPNFIGEVGLNADAMQLIQFLMAQTSKINFGTAIHNIVGGNGGPIASADRVSMLAFINQFQKKPRELKIGFAAGRFPYINDPFGIRPRNAVEAKHWNECKKYIFFEACEIFLRLCQGETLDSKMIRRYTLSHGEPLDSRWHFESLKIIPEPTSQSLEKMRFVLGSHDPQAEDLCLQYSDIDIFNLSFTPPDQINAAHERMAQKMKSHHRPWSRERMPRTVLVFIDASSSRAQDLAQRTLSTYREAMRGTVTLPPQEELVARALIGTPEQIAKQLADPLRFHRDDRLMLWFEFNQNQHQDICEQMRLFAPIMKDYLS